jgi:DNA-binding NtrC family response regulator
MRDGDDLATAVNAVARAPSPLATGCSLMVEAGPDAGSTFGVEASAAGRVFIGQSAACEVRLRDRSVSRRHAALELQPAGLRLTDLGSTNGTWVGDLRVHDAVLSGGERLRLGETTLRVQATAPVAVPTSNEPRFGKTIGASPAMRRLYPVCARLAASEVPVLIEGETGTGKEVLAESIHDAGPRAEGPFVILDCTTLAATLAESTIFGHERGAFTGAHASQPGVFEEADGGTLFIDEIGELDVALQPKLLRAIERSEVRRLGGAKWKRVDVRIVSATRRDLEKEIQAGRFREDLYFRLAVGRVELPPLRRREGDVAVHAATVWRALGGDPGALAPDFLRHLEAYGWPGNVRELKNFVARRFALGDLSEVCAPLDARPDAVTDAFMKVVLDRDLPFPAARDLVLAEFERRYVARVLTLHGGNVGMAAGASGIGRRYFQTIRGRTRRGEE